MKIVEARFLTTGDPYDPAIENWSRCYEYPLIMRKLKGSKMIHNAACGAVRQANHGQARIHLQFMRRLEKLSAQIINSDILSLSDDPEIRQLDPVRMGFVEYNILRPWSGRLRFDAVVCISTLEHLKPEDRHDAVMNLYNQLRAGGRLLVTFDCDDAKMFSEIIGCHVEIPHNVLTRSTSKKPNRTAAPTMIGHFEIERE